MDLPFGGNTILEDTLCDSERLQYVLKNVLFVVGRRLMM
ncbi:MAG: hypothetical protein JWO06_207 [Bacteroidota bacterium]|nr:hypothetical protein [Bacteroidota bacterium]